MRARTVLVVTLAAALAAAPAGTAAAAGITSRTGTASAVSAAEVPLTTPVFTTPTGGARVTGVVTATVTSLAAQVRFALPAVGFTADVPVTGGTATTQVPTWGAEGPQTLLAADCDPAAGCGTPASVAVTVDNPAPVLTGPPDGATVGGSFTASATAGGGAVRFLVDGATAATDTATPFEQTLSTADLTAGQHTLTAVQCDAAGTTCAEQKPSTPVALTVLKNLSPVITSISPSPFSPGTDGRLDTATVAYRLETAQTVAWRVTTTDGSQVVPSRSLGEMEAGTHAFTFAGKRPDGGYLTTGRYVVHLDTSKAVVDPTLTGHTQHPVKVDRTPARMANVHATPATFYPARDDYRDSTTLSGRLSERVTSMSVDVFTSGGRRVRTIRLAGRSAGPVSVTWNGRRSNGDMAAEGSYRLRFRTQDLAGNLSTTGKYTVTVSHKKLEKRTGKKKVTALGSKTTLYKGACSELFSPGVRGWAKSIGYYSDFYECSSDQGDDLAAAVHAVSLPEATRYGWVRVAAYGGKAVDKHDDVAVLLYYDSDRHLTDTGTVLGAKVQTYAAPRVGARFVSDRGRVRWFAGTQDGNHYDIKTFTVRYTYFVLR